MDSVGGLGAPNVSIWPKTFLSRSDSTKSVAVVEPTAWGICGGGWCRRGLMNRSLTSLQQRLVKTRGRLVKHARYYWLLLAEGHLTRRLFGAMRDALRS